MPEQDQMTAADRIKAKKEAEALEAKAKNEAEMQNKIDELTKRLIQAEDDKRSYETKMLDEQRLRQEAEEKLEASTASMVVSEGNTSDSPKVGTNYSDILQTEAWNHVAALIKRYPETTPNSHTVFGYGGTTVSLGDLRAIFS